MIDMYKKLNELLDLLDGVTYVFVLRGKKYRYFKLTIFGHKGMPLNKYFDYNDRGLQAAIDDSKEYIKTHFYESNI